MYLPLFFVEKIHSFLNFRNNCQVCTKKTFYFALFLCQEVCFFLVKKYLSGCIINLCCFSEVPSACLIWLFFWHCHVPESTFSHFFHISEWVIYIFIHLIHSHIPSVLFTNAVDYDHWFFFFFFFLPIWLWWCFPDLIACREGNCSPRGTKLMQTKYLFYVSVTTGICKF